jgi:regulator of replication initiation timing
VSALKAQVEELARENQKLQAANQERDARLAAVEKFIANQSRSASAQSSSARDVK